MENNLRYQERKQIPDPHTVEIISGLSIDSIENIEEKNAVVSYNYLCYKLKQEIEHLGKIDDLIENIRTETGISSESEALKALDESKQTIKDNIENYRTQIDILERSDEIHKFVSQKAQEAMEEYFREKREKVMAECRARQKQFAEQKEQEKLQKHLDNLNLQAEEFKKEVPSFNLREELKNPEFAILTSPDNNQTIKEAYYSVHPEYRKKLRTANLKENLLSSARTIGFVSWYLLTIVISVLPFVMIDVPFLWTFILIGIQLFIPVTSAIFWAWGLVCAIMGTQDIFAIVYYILFVILYLPFFVVTLSNLISKLFNRK